MNNSNQPTSWVPDPFNNMQNGHHHSQPFHSDLEKFFVGVSQTEFSVLTLEQLATCCRDAFKVEEKCRKKEIKSGREREVPVISRFEDLARCKILLLRLKDPFDHVPSHDQKDDIFAIQTARAKVAHMLVDRTLDDYSFFYEIINESVPIKFPKKYHRYLQNLFHSAKYAELSRTKQKRELGAVDKYRIRKKFPLPDPIWDNEDTVYCFKVGARDKLKRSFGENRYPSPTRKKMLALETELDITQVSNWFKNRRQRDKDSMKKNGSVEPFSPYSRNDDDFEDHRQLMTQTTASSPPSPPPQSFASAAASIADHVVKMEPQTPTQVISNPFPFSRPPPLKSYHQPPLKAYHPHHFPHFSFPPPPPPTPQSFNVSEEKASSFHVVPSPTPFSNSFDTDKSVMINVNANHSQSSPPDETNQDYEDHPLFIDQEDGHHHHHLHQHPDHQQQMHESDYSLEDHNNHNPHHNHLPIHPSPHHQEFAMTSSGYVYEPGAYHA